MWRRSLCDCRRALENRIEGRCSAGLEKARRCYRAVLQIVMAADLLRELRKIDWADVGLQQEVELELSHVVGRATIEQHLARCGAAVVAALDDVAIGDGNDHSAQFSNEKPGDRRVPLAHIAETVQLVKL